MMSDSQQGTVICPPCKGTGRTLGKSAVKCTVCRGEGLLPASRIHLPLCHFCNGSGIHPGSVMICNECNGWGHRERKLVVDRETETEKLGRMVLALGVRSLAERQINVVQIEAGRPHTAHLEVAKLLQSLIGEIRICDPYYGTGSLLRLAEIPTNATVKLLTQKPDGKEKTFIAKAIADFAKRAHARSIPGAHSKRFTRPIHCHRQRVHPARSWLERHRWEGVVCCKAGQNACW